ncbi:RNA polymerase sigma-54 factor [Spirochaetia bacterium]|nr:RNA polymerase sigma-54 factor [Spirochaetia bacterium]
MQQIQRAGFAQEQRLSQRMNTQLIQSIKLMELPIIDLREKIQDELEKNPALEVLEDKSMVSINDIYKAGREENEYFESTSDSGFIHGGKGERNSDDRRQFIEGALTQSETLQEHLLWQLRLYPCGEEIRRIGERLIQNIDSDGFHLVDPPLLFNKSAKSNICSSDDMKTALTIIRGFEPIGCCTADYKESLCVQAALLYPDDAADIELIIPHLEELERDKFSKVAKLIERDQDELRELYDELKNLSPFPGRQFNSGGSGSGGTRFVIPDVQIIRKDGEFSILLNEEEIPVLGIQPFFIKQNAKGIKNSEQDFIRENVKEARWFIQSINRRNHTLLRVTRAIVEFQHAFFADGPKHLAPLTLNDIAEELGVHQTTVSRAANGKYMQTEWGIFEIRHFFTNSISGSGSSGSRYSREAVKEIIKEIITGENANLSDKDISDILTKRGIPLARRTVAKYRSQLDLGSSYKR